MFSESRQNLLQILSVFSLIASEFHMNTEYQQSSKYDFNYVQDYSLALFGDIYPKTACMWKNSPNRAKIHCQNQCNEHSQYPWDLTEHKRK